MTTNTALADIPAAGAKALSDYLKDCDAHEIQPDVGGAFAYAFRAGAALTTAAAVPPADWWRKRADEIELRVAQSGCTEAMRTFTDMRTLLQAAAAPKAEPVSSDWDMRGHLAASLTCWHRLTGQEAAELVALFQGHPAQAAPAPNAALYDPREVAFTAQAAPQPAVQQGELIGWIKSSEIDSAKRMGGSINLWLKKYDCDTPLYTHTAAPVAQGDAEDAARYRWLRESWFTMDSNYKSCITFRTGRPRWSDFSENDQDAAIDTARAQAASGQPRA
jgi:hypothetical protein